MSWYVGPFAAEQRAFNEALLHFADELSARNDEPVRRSPRRPRRAGRPDDEAALEHRLDQEQAAREGATTRLETSLEERGRSSARSKSGSYGSSATPRRSHANHRRRTTRRRRASRLLRVRVAHARRHGGDHGPPAYVEDFRRRGGVDLGCGRGEFVALLRMQASRRAASTPTRTWWRMPGEGLDVEQADALAALERLEDDELGGVFASTAARASAATVARRLLQLAAAKLRPGGILVAETINPLSPLALRNYFADLTHAQPLVPETLELLVRQAGFSEAEKLSQRAGGAADAVR